jgi:hypothetical protein
MSLEYRVDSLESEVRRCKSEIEAVKDRCRSEIQALTDRERERKRLDYYWLAATLDVSEILCLRRVSVLRIGESVSV